jgi:hypothetical protein
MASLVKARARRIRRRAHLEEFVVLVWGPGDPGPGADADALLAYRKRLEIRQNLEREFPEAEVVFSEDAAMA